ncbi:MAG: SusC/RagA family TonB-linked outer membrane protein, partial [Bacteroidales bacterium]|nr:SusC/RagA family TonB-linked outer membrane protein [Bacteroidales bacterium]
MKLATFLLLTCFTTFASPGYSQPEKVTVNLNDANLKEFFGAIEKQTQYKFLYRDDAVENIVVSLDEMDKPLDQVLHQILEGSGFSYKILDNNLIVIGSKEVLQQQKITGTVTDENEKPLAGVTVLVIGTSNGAMTNIDGNYSLDVEGTDAILKFSFIGYVTQEIRVGNQPSINVKMVTEVTSLEDIVVVGYGTIKKSSLISSIGTVGSAEIIKVPATNISATLTGKVAGLISIQRDGRPGRDASSVSIRGFGEPLIIVDGTQRDFSQLDPHEIESVSVLKDASAAIYGARAGNGVILVTTKSGNRNTPVRIAYTGTFTMQQPAVWPHWAPAKDYVKYRNTAEVLGGFTEAQRTYSDAEILKWEQGTRPGYQGADWQSLTFMDWAPLQQHNFSVSGGSQTANYFVSLGNLNQASLLRSGAGTYERYNIRTNVDVSVTKSLSSSIKMSYRRGFLDGPANFSGTRGPDNYSAIFNSLQESLPTVAPIPNEPDLMAHTSIRGENPVAISRQDINGFVKNWEEVIDVNLSLDLKLPIKGLTLEGKIGYNSNNFKYKELSTPYNSYIYDYETETIIQTLTAARDQSYISEQRNQSSQLVPQIALRYTGSFGNHTFSALFL